MRKYSLGLLLIVFCFLTMSPVSAQDNEPSTYVINVRDGIIEVHRILADGSTEFVGTIANIQWRADPANTMNTIPYRYYISASPDNRYIAFTAVDFEAKSYLYVFDTETATTSHQIEIPFMSWIAWSPDSMKIMLRFTAAYYDLEDNPELFIYDLALETLTQITDVPSLRYVETSVWSPDSTYVIFSKICEECSSLADNLYYVDINGENTRQLTHLEDETISYNSVGICQITWNPLNQRWYYEVGCRAPEESGDVLYSVDLEGNNRLEDDLPIRFDRLDLGLGRYGTDVFSLLPTPTGIYTINQISNGGEDYIIEVQHFGDAESIQTLASLTLPYLHFYKYLEYAGFSPDGRRIAIVGDEILDDIHGKAVYTFDLASGEFMFHTVILPEQSQPICRINWQNDHALLIETRTNQSCGNPEQYSKIWSLDLETNQFMQIATNLEGIVGVYPASNEN